MRTSALVKMIVCLSLPHAGHAQTKQSAPRSPESAVTPVNMSKNQRQKSFLKLAQDPRINLVFLGDSITENWLRDDGRHGKPVWDRYFAGLHAVNFAVSGERTEHTLGRIEGGLLNKLNPTVVILLIGTNNIGHPSADLPEWAALGVRKVVSSIQSRLPDTKILLLGIFPRAEKDSQARKAVEKINSDICSLENGTSIRFLDLGPRLIDSRGEIPTHIMPDGLHPNTRGYQIWAESMVPLLSEMMSDGK